jgi:hypothetical protein
MGSHDLNGTVGALDTGCMPQDDLVSQFCGFQQICDVDPQLSQEAIR